MSKLAWGILATGGIAHTFARGLAESQTGGLLAVGSRTQEAADRFGDEFSVPRRYGSYEALLADPQVQAVYLSPPHPMHAEWAIRAAQAGKHILCEKPLGMNEAEARRIVQAARENDVFLMEAFMYRCHPQTARLVELLREGSIGEVRVIQATFSFAGRPDPAGRQLNKALGGGGILDVGCYCTSMARLVAGVATGGEIAEPLEVKGTAQIGETGVDEYAVAAVRFPGGILGELATGVRVSQDNVVRIFGTEGKIEVPSPWFGSRDPGVSRIWVHADGQPEPREVLVESDRGLYTIEADTVAASIEARQASFPAMTWEDTLGNMRMLDRWRESVGLRYEADG
jgi:predicted dehydrogenase